VQKWENDGLVL